jgi:hypothetical protein
VRVGVQGQPGRAVAEQVSHDLRVLASRQEKTGETTKERLNDLRSPLVSPAR